MAKIDITKIEGYDEMTPEEKLAALEAFEYEDNSSELEKYKSAASKANSEAAEWRKKHNALLSEEGRKKQENEEELTNLRQKVEALEQEKLIANHKASLLALGYSEKLAEDTAKAFASNDAQGVLAGQKAFIEEQRRAIKEELYRTTPTPPSGQTGSRSATDYSKLINEAQGRGDYAAAAYYTRLSEQDKANNQ